MFWAFPSNEPPLELTPRFELQGPRFDPVGLSTFKDRFSIFLRVSRCPNSSSLILLETLYSILIVMSSKSLSDKLEMSPFWWSLGSIFPLFSSADGFAWYLLFQFLQVILGVNSGQFLPFFCSDTPVPLLSSQFCGAETGRNWFDDIFSQPLMKFNTTFFVIFRQFSFNLYKWSFHADCCEIQ